MSFSARQLQCLQAMGLVAWTSEQAPVQLPANATLPDSHLLQVNTEPETPTTQMPQSVAVTPIAERASAITASDAQGLPQAALAVAEAATDQLSLDDLAHWLVTQPLVQFQHRGVSVNCLGPEQATLLVVCIAQPSLHNASEQLPIDSEGSALFDLMMRSINLSRNHYRQCVVAAEQGEQAQSGASGGVDTLCSAQTRAVLLLDPGIVEPVSDAKGDHCLLPGLSLPLWRIPHPQQVLLTPLLKRRAWESLKNVQQALTS